ncbi:carboxylesterase family protein [Mycobacterium sp. M1]|uniref:Carboxylic ester hydrolase n=1 Tax=Mycolicibacter acidiphilus TaxID=2835306 RepID=A0ABS5RMY4_9MYCO|nr:carboxylesterase family protein [Mycolicibacter acidiphilus]MBS9534908.1 carboxylesterase family protein [Mycolicibacter acidiphilus]
MPIGSTRRHRGLRAGVAALAFIAVLTGAGCADPAGPAPSNPSRAVALNADVVHTATGLVRGQVGPDHRLFQGIPYAAAPVGALRWRPPEPAAAWRGVRDAVKPGPWCIQPDVAPEDPISEDCLTLNVWTPAGSAAEPLPVMVWIHGGSFMRGSGDIYHSQRLAVRGRVVVVTINYRLGALGFLADPALGEPGNYGLADQQAALRWVHENIAGFGGDPTKVTIAGESAGGMSVCDHLAAPYSAGLFRAAIIQSGPCQTQVDAPTAQRLSREYTETLGCGPRDRSDRGVEACLRALPADRLTEPLWYARFGNDRLSGPVVGVPTLPTDPVRVMTDGDAVRVPVLLGVTHDEFTLFEVLRSMRLGREIGAAEYPGLLAETFGAGDGTAVLEHYPASRYGGSSSQAYAAAATDDIFACLADRMADALVRSAPAVYAYEFDDPHAPAPEIFREAPFPLGASHSLEIRYLFDVGGAPALDAAQRRLSDEMVEYWTGFVTTGTPAGVGQPDWPTVGTDPLNARWMSLRPNGSRVVTDFGAEHQCGFWAGLQR